MKLQSLIYFLLILIGFTLGDVKTKKANQFDSIYRKKRNTDIKPYVIKKIEFTTSEQKQGVDEQNRRRSQVQPPATNMLKLSFNKELADFAQNYSRQCIYEHNPKYNTKSFSGIGENLYLSTKIRSNLFDALNQGIKLWFDENKYYNFTAKKCLPGKVCGHYTEMVWAENYLVGCGITNCGNVSVDGVVKPQAQYVVCNYAPGGNYEGEAPYIAGKSCSQCPGKNKCVCSSLDEKTHTKNGVLEKVTSAFVETTQTTKSPKINGRNNANANDTEKGTGVRYSSNLLTYFLLALQLLSFLI